MNTIPIKGREPYPGRDLEPFFCETDRAKVYWRFTAPEEITVNNYNIQFEKNYYKTYSAIKWRITTNVSTGEYQPLKGLIMQDAYVTITTNSHNNIVTGDIVELNGTAWTVESVEIEYMYVPKRVLRWQHLSLRRVN